MNLDEFEKYIEDLEIKTNKVFRNMDKIIAESERVSNIAKNSEEIFDKLETEFKKQTGLDGIDLIFLFFATALQCSRIYFVNNLTKIEKAGSKNRNEKFLKKQQEKIFKNFTNNSLELTHDYYAPLEQIITTSGVPYDATKITKKYQNLNLFKGANHRFSTLAHDPILGYIFGTANILTNTITTIDLPIISTNHVRYDTFFKNPIIGSSASTIDMIKKVSERWNNDKKSVIAAIIKQTIHIGTDLYTTCGIQIPAANLVLSKSHVEYLTKFISTGDIIKIGISSTISILINGIIEIIHSLLYNKEKHSSRELYSVKTKKIIMYSNIIASSSNLIWESINIVNGNINSVKNLDIGGLIVTIIRIVKDKKFIRDLKEEFIYGNFKKMIAGEDLELEEI